MVVTPFLIAKDVGNTHGRWLVIHQTIEVLITEAREKGIEIGEEVKIDIRNLKHVAQVTMQPVDWEQSECEQSEHEIEQGEVDSLFGGDSKGSGGPDGFRGRGDGGW